MYRYLKKTIPAFLIFFGLLTLLGSCTGSKPTASALQKFGPEQLREDYDVLKNVLEKFHPSLYWYTPKDSMDFFFDVYRSALADSMTQQQFGFRILAPLTTKIRCGHTSFSFSREYARFFRGMPLPSIPLYLKIWGDTMLITKNLNRKDSLLKKGMQVSSINGLKAPEMTATMFRFMPTDGYAQNINYIRLSTAFPYYHRNIFGLSRTYRIGYIDSTGAEKVVTVPFYNPVLDTAQSGDTKKELKAAAPRKSRNDKRTTYRSMEIDSHNNLAVMYISSFDDGSRLKSFYRKSFRKIKKEKIPNLVIDIRNNGGGKVNHYTQLARYIRHTPFKVADTAYAIRRHFGTYGKYFQQRSINSLGLKVFTSPDTLNRYHFRYWENHAFKPKRQNHFTGQVYVLISGPTFSASTLFCNTVAGQKNVILVGEETGGGHYGNNGLMIPYITLPNTRMRVSVPLFRIVQYNHSEKNGRGVQPDIVVPPAAEAVRNGIDLKMEKVRELIREPQSLTRQF